MALCPERRDPKPWDDPTATPLADMARWAGVYADDITSVRLPEETPVTELTPEAQAVLDAALLWDDGSPDGSGVQEEVERMLVRAIGRYKTSLIPPPVVAYTGVRRGEAWTAITPVYAGSDGWRLLDGEDAWEIEITFKRRVR